MIETLPPAFALVFAGAFGALIGSFLNVCIHRLPLGASIVWPSSACPHCSRELSWYENIPVVSYCRCAGDAARAVSRSAPLSAGRGADVADVRAGMVAVRPRAVACRAP
jgi:hypothetical protein